MNRRGWTMWRRPGVTYHTDGDWMETIRNRRWTTGTYIPKVPSSPYQLHQSTEAMCGIIRCLSGNFDIAQQIFDTYFRLRNYLLLLYCTERQFSISFRREEVRFSEDHFYRTRWGNWRYQELGVKDFHETEIIEYWCLRCCHDEQAPFLQCQSAKTTGHGREIPWVAAGWITLAMFAKSDLRTWTPWEPIQWDVQYYPIRLRWVGFGNCPWRPSWS